MFQKDIELAFTAKVSEYLANGYVFNVGSMAGSQGEIASVDLRKGDEIIRVVLLRGDDSWDAEYVSLIVGRNTDYQHKSWGNTIWTCHLDVIEEHKFWKVSWSADYYVSEAEARAAAALRAKRYAMRATKPEKVYIFPEAAKQIVLPFMKRQKDCKSIRLSQIEGVTRHVRNGKVFFQVVAKGTVYRLH